MNRNSEQHYSQVPRAEIRRARFKRDYSLLTTINEGDLVPIYLDEVLPADTFKVNVNALVRMSTPLYPVMDNAYMDYYFFFVPARLLWEHFENLMGQNDKTFWAEATEYTTPQTTAPSGGWNVGTLADYFGIPTGVANLSVNSMPFRAYCKVWNEWFRDENLQQPVTMSKTDATTAGSNTGTSLNDAEKGGMPLKGLQLRDGRLGKENRNRIPIQPHNLRVDCHTQKRKAGKFYRHGRTFRWNSTCRLSGSRSQ